MKRFENKVALVTGAASGMGLLSCQMLAEEGAHVLMLDINEEILEKEAAEIRAWGGDAIAMKTDVRRYEAIEAAVEKAMALYGHVDITISFAGGAPSRMCKVGKPFHQLPIEVLDWGVEVNFRAPMYMARAAMQHMMDQGSGVIINIGSTSGETGTSSNADYSAEKSGIAYGLTKSLAAAGAPYGVRCCAVSPGPVLTRAAMANMKTALGRAAEPVEVVKLVLYLCSQDAAFITGVNYVIDGGRALLLP